LSDQRYQWRGARNYVLLDPAHAGARVQTAPAVRSERDFDYFL
jgi:hypothetical protein